MLKVTHDRETYNTFFLIVNTSSRHENFHICKKKTKAERQGIIVHLLTLCSSSLEAATPNIKAAPPKTIVVATANAFPT